MRKYRSLFVLGFFLFSIHTSARAQGIDPIPAQDPNILAKAIHALRGNFERWPGHQRGVSLGGQALFFEKIKPNRLVEQDERNDFLQWNKDILEIHRHRVEGTIWLSVNEPYETRTDEVVILVPDFETRDRERRVFAVHFSSTNSTAGIEITKMRAFPSLSSAWSISVASMGFDHARYEFEAEDKREPFAHFLIPFGSHLGANFNEGRSIDVVWDEVDQRLAYNWDTPAHDRGVLGNNFARVLMHHLGEMQRVSADRDQYPHAMNIRSLLNAIEPNSLIGSNPYSLIEENYAGLRTYLIARNLLSLLESLDFSVGFNQRHRRSDPRRIVDATYKLLETLNPACILCDRKGEIELFGQPIPAYRANTTRLSFLLAPETGEVLQEFLSTLHGFLDEIDTNFSVSREKTIQEKVNQLIQFFKSENEVSPSLIGKAVIGNTRLGKTEEELMAGRKFVEILHEISHLLQTLPLLIYHYQTAIRNEASFLGWEHARNLEELPSLRLHHLNSVRHLQMGLDPQALSIRAGARAIGSGRYLRFLR